jgi:REP element-mobilizing transposase RayT
VLAPRVFGGKDAAMVLAYHCIFSAYGFWLPNDPRGSGSDYIASWELFRYGPATRTHSKRSAAYRAHDQALRRKAKEALKHPPVAFTGKQALAAAEGFAWAADEGEYSIHACAVLPDHVHLVIGRHAQKIRKIVGHCKARATRLLHTREGWPDDRPVWGEHGWNVFLSTADEVEHAIAYVNDNPPKEGKPAQRWSFVKPFHPSVALSIKRTLKVAPPQKRGASTAAK